MHRLIRISNTLARLERLAAGPKYQDYVKKQKGKGEKPLKKDEWESKVLGKPKKGEKPKDYKGPGSGKGKGKGKPKDKAKGVDTFDIEKQVSDLELEISDLQNYDSKIDRWEEYLGQFTDAGERDSLRKDIPEKYGDWTDANFAEAAGIARDEIGYVKKNQAKAKAKKEKDKVKKEKDKDGPKPAGWIDRGK